VAGILKHAPDLPDVATRVKAGKDAIRYAYPGSELEKQAKTTSNNCNPRDLHSTAALNQQCNKKHCGKSL
jgi:hypothetical protein